MAAGLAGAPALPNIDIKSFRLEKAPAKAPAAPAKKRCAKDWKKKRQGDCWIGSGNRESYVHRRGYVVAKSCLSDSRFTAKQMVDAMEGAYRKMDPKTPVSGGGCMSKFNPEWGAELVKTPWEKNVLVACPEFDKTSTTCASHYDNGRNSVIIIKNIEVCMDKRSSGLSGVMFHETLHAAGVDNFPASTHNKAWKLPQIKWIQDRIYAAEAVCYFGVFPDKKKEVNLIQCLGTVRYNASSPRDHLCKGFDAYFTDRRPSGFMRH